MSRERRQGGVTLVELMVALTISLFVVLAVSYAYLAAKTSLNAQTAESRLQEAARYAFEYMGMDVRMTGFSGGSRSSTVNLVNTPTWDRNLKSLYGTEADGGRPLAGYQEGVSTFPTFSPARLRGDALTVVHADTDNEYHLCLPADSDATCTGNWSPPALTLRFATCPSSDLPQAGEVFVASDYTHSAVFQLTSAGTCSGGSQTLGYGGSATPGNSASDLGAFNGAARERTLYRLKGATYYVATNPAGEPALYRQELGHSGTTATTVATELVEGVEDMQVTYGEDTSVSADRVVDRYVSANAVADWSRVLSVRISLLLVSPAGQAVTTAPQPYDFNGATDVIPTDRLLRRVLTSTIAIRNRLIP